jgi:hypothetical protein
MSTHTTEGTLLLCMDGPACLFADLLYPRYSPKTSPIHSLWYTSRRPLSYGSCLLISNSIDTGPNLRLSRAEGQDIGSCQGHEGLLRCRGEA